MLDEYWAPEQPKVDVLRSTGLYAKAGTAVEIAVAKDFLNKIQVISTAVSKLSKCNFWFTIYLAENNIRLYNECLLMES